MSTLNTIKWSYKVLGHGSVEITEGNSSIQASLHETMIAPKPNVFRIQAILDALGKEGWELVSDKYPYIFKRWSN